MDSEDRLRLITKDVSEIVTEENLRALIAEKKRPKAYIGFEPSGMMHVGQGINALKVVEMNRADVEFTIFLADWHAKINDKMGGDMEKIRACGEYLKHCFLGFGVDPEKTKFVYASEIVDKADYWETFVHISKACSLSRVKRAMSIMGREEGDAEMDFSKLVYPPMQVADIFQLKVDIAYGGMDQRHAHMLALDVADKLGWKKAVMMHSWLLPSLSGSGRMDTAQKKMSKSDPKTSIVVNDSAEDIAKKLSSAYCPAKDVQDNPVLSIAERLIFPATGKFELRRKPEHGGDLQYKSCEELAEAYAAGKIHPKDLKDNMARELSSMLEPVRKHFEKNPAPLAKMRELVAGRQK